MSRLRAALVTPMSGPLARFGRAGEAALRLWAEAAARLPPPWHGVDLAVYDAYPAPAEAMHRAAAAGPHVLFGPYGSSPAVAAIGATERVVWNHGGATSALAWPAYPRVVNVLASAASYYAGTLALVRRAVPAARTVSLLHASTGFPAAVAAGVAARAPELGFAVRTTVFAPGEAAAAACGLADGDVLLVAGAFEDELAAARVLLRRAWPAAAFVGAGVQHVLAPLGAQREGVLGPAQWTAACAPEPDEGPEAAWFTARFVAATGAEPEYPAAQAFAAGVLCARCIRDAGGVDDADVFAVARQLHCTTLFGAFALDGRDGLQVGHEPLTVQWQDGQPRVVWPLAQAAGPFVFPRSAHPVPRAVAGRAGEKHTDRGGQPTSG